MTNSDDQQPAGLFRGPPAMTDAVLDFGRKLGDGLIIFRQEEDGVIAEAVIPLRFERDEALAGPLGRLSCLAWLSDGDDASEPGLAHGLRDISEIV